MPVMLSTTANPDVTGSLWHPARFLSGENKGWAVTLCGWSVIAYRRGNKRVVCREFLKILAAKKRK